MEMDLELISKQKTSRFDEARLRWWWCVKKMARP
jgi:hypothetical protein